MSQSIMRWDTSLQEDFSFFLRDVLLLEEHGARLAVVSGAALVDDDAVREHEDAADHEPDALPSSSTASRSLTTVQ